MTINLAEVFLLSGRQLRFMASGGEAEEQAEVDRCADSSSNCGHTREFSLPREPEDQRRPQGEKESAAGRQKSQDGQRRREVHVARDHNVGSSTRHHRSILSDVWINLVSNP